MSQNQIHVLYVGYSHDDSEDPNIMRANCSCTLIQTRSGRNIIVDTMTAWDGECILEALAAHNVKPDDIYAVVCTHGHSDHVGCNYLFQKAKWHFTGACASHRDQYLVDWDGFNNEGGEINAGKFQLDGNDVILERTPGHTLTCVSVIVRETSLGKTVGICGDLFECAEDIADSKLWINAGSENMASQREQRLRMANMCDYIIPGHSKGFVVTAEMRKTLQQDLEANKSLI